MSPTEITILSKLQEPVVSDSRPRILVSAGAGSGKTRLLVAYFVQALLEERIPAEQLAAVTFTRKAAGELVERIRTELRARGRPDLAWSLEAATIGTIHSLCRSLIKERALEAGVDPACAGLEEEAAALLKDEVSRQAWESVVEQADEAELDTLARRGEGLRRLVMPLYDQLRGMGWEAPCLDIAPGEREEVARSRLAAAIDIALAAAADLERRTPTLQTDLAKLQNCLAWLEAAAGQPAATAEEIETALAATAGFFPSRRTSSIEPAFEPVREALVAYRCMLAEKRLRPLVGVMNRLLEEFHRRYEARKVEGGLLDFVDLELRARALVAGDPGDRRGAGPGVAAGSGATGAAAPDPVMPGSRVLIDEFQDTNELQCSILEGLGASRLLMVGDERQSIYRFRGADVDVFRRREAGLAARAPEDPEGTLYRLDVNYRSRPEILAFLNRLFAHASFFGERFVPLRPPDPDEKSTATAPAPGTGGAASPAQGPTPPAPAVEILAADRRQADDPEAPLRSIQEAEAGVIAERVRRLITEEGCAQRDIVVLLPAYTSVDQYRQALLDRGVEVYVVRGKGYYSKEEVTDIVSLLRLLVNPHDDLALVSALRSPLAGLSDDGLYLLGREERQKGDSLWETARDAVRGGRVGALGSDDRYLLAGFVERLDELRAGVGRPGLARLIDDCAGAFDYDLCLLASPEGKRRFANVRKLMRLADDFERLEGPDLAGFLGLLSSIGELSDREGSAPTLAEGEDVVRVMTVHQAKGLEFPVVILGGLGSDVYHENPAEFAVGVDGRMGAFLKGSRNKTYETNDLCWGPAADIVEEVRRKENEEDIRLLYVAMTRAKERLVLVGAIPTGNSLEGCRIGRIVTALGLESLPSEDTSVALEGLGAVVASIGPSSAAEAVPAAAPGTDSGTDSVDCNDAAGEDAVPPQFLEAPARGQAPRHVSFSALAAYQRCPRRFYLEWVLHLDLAPAACARAGATAAGAAFADTDGDEGEFWAGESREGPPAEELLDDYERTTGRDIGLLVHRLLERAPADGRTPSEEELGSIAADWLHQSGVILSAAELTRALALARAFWDSPLAGVLSTPEALREARFFFAQKDIMVSGVMDLVAKEEDLWRIVDYKTNALAGRSPAQVASEYELQGVVYSLAALLAGAPAVRLDFLFLERPAEPQAVQFSRGDISRLKNRLDEVLAGLRRAEYPLAPDEHCRYCAAAEVCAGMARS
jgi:ATP-dependent helicase/nuclease subunit A